MRGCLGGGEESGRRAGVNEEPLQEAELVDVELDDGIVGGKAA